MFKTLSSKMPYILALVVLFALFFGKFLPLNLQQILYTFSLLVKETLIFLLPVIIFSLLFGSIVNLGGEKGAIRLIFLLFGCVCLSNFLATWVGYFSGFFSVNFIDNIKQVDTNKNLLTPLFDISFPNWIKNEVALILSLIMGLIYVHFFKIKRKNFASKLSSLATSFLQNFFVPIVPFFILGFVIKLQYDGVLSYIVKNYIFIFLLIFLTQIIYILFLFGVSVNFKFRDWIIKVRNTIPPFLTGFGTMSSAATMPITLLAAEKNTKNQPLSRVVIPATVNIHLIGDSIAIPIFALAILCSFGVANPSYLQYLMFTVFFVAARFAVAAVPGGGIIVVLPILEEYLSFNSEMLSLIMAMYIMFDTVITSMNVAGNSVFVIIFNKIDAILFKRNYKCN